MLICDSPKRHTQSDQAPRQRLKRKSKVRGQRRAGRTQGWRGGRTGVWQRFATNWAVAVFKPVTTAFRESRLRSLRDVSGVIRSQGVAFAVGRQSRTDFAFGASVAPGDEVAEWPEKTGLLTVSDGRIVSLRGASSSHYQRECELIFTAVAEGGRGSMAHLVANRCHTRFTRSRAHPGARPPSSSLRPFATTC